MAEGNTNHLAKILIFTGTIIMFSSFNQKILPFFLTILMVYADMLHLQKNHPKTIYIFARVHTHFHAY